MCLVTTRWRLVFFILSCLPLRAEAQINRQYSLDGVLSWSFTHPSLGTDGSMINCAYPQSFCQPFNLVACNSNTPVEISVGRGTAPAQPQLATQSGVYAFAWLQQGATTCTNAPLTSTTTVADPNDPTDPNATTTVTAGTIFGIGANSTGTGQAVNPINTSSQFAGGTNGTDIPLDFGLQSFTVGDIMNAFPGVCDSAGIAFTQYRLCFGVNGSGNAYINQANAPSTTTPTIGGSTTAGRDIVGWFQFPIATVPPPTPASVQTESLVSRVQVTVSVDNSLQNIFGVVVSYTSDPSDIALTNPNSPSYAASATCANWQQQTLTPLDEISLSDTAATVVVAGTNGVEYAYCAQTIDFVGNVSPWSEVVQDYPHTECGLFDCWPPGVPIDAGYCTAAPPSFWWLAVTLAGWRGRSVRARVRRRGSRDTSWAV